MLLPAFLPELSGRTGESNTPPAANPGCGLEAFVRERLAPTFRIFTRTHIDRSTGSFWPWSWNTQAESCTTLLGYWELHGKFCAKNSVNSVCT